MILLTIELHRGLHRVCREISLVNSINSVKDFAKLCGYKKNNNLKHQ